MLKLVDIFRFIMLVLDCKAKQKRPSAKSVPTVQNPRENHKHLHKILISNGHLIHNEL